MIIDAYAHVLPMEVVRAMERTCSRFVLAKRLMAVRELYDMDARFRAMDALPDYRQIVSLPNPPIESVAKGADALNLARLTNDALAELVQRYPDRFPAFVATLPMDDVVTSVGEMKRAIETLGACGVQVFSNVDGHPLDEEQYRQIFATMAEYDLPIWLHPAGTPAKADYLSESHSRFEMWWCFGWPYQTTLAMSRLVLSGLFDRHPNLKIITHHFGGMVPYFDKRIENGLAILGSRSGEEDDVRALSSLKAPLISYFHKFYADTALFGASHGLQCGLDFFGTKKVVFASDAPFGPIVETYAAVASLEVEAGGKEAMFRTNCETLIKRKVR